MKSRFETQAIPSNVINMALTEKHMRLQIDTGEDGFSLLNVDEVETLRDEFERYGRALRGKDAPPPGAFLSFEELTAVLESLDAVLSADGSIGPNLRSAWTKLSRAYNVTRRERQS